MIARVLDIPDDEAALAGWLDEQVAADDLHELIAELAAVHAANGPRGSTPQAAAEWLGESLPDVLSRGTAALPRPRLGELLRSPWLLAGLQELVFMEGGDYWNNLALRGTPAPAFSSADVLERAAKQTAPEGGARPRGPAAARPMAVPPSPRSQSRLPVAVAAVAAGLLVAVAGWSLLRPGLPEPVWGWNRPDALTAAAGPDAYLEQLARAADEWSAAAPTTERQLAARLGDLLVGCDRLIAAPHKPLEPADRDWLVERCRAWREKIAGHVAALETSHDVAAVRRDADATVEKLVKAIRSRAAEIRGRDSSRA